MDKAPVEASKFKVRLGKHTSTAVLHTRFATQGAPAFNRNNHPIPVGERGRRIVGVHNGHIYNDDTLFRNDLQGMERRGEVDSEAVFAYLYKYGPTPVDLKRVWGSYALGYLYEQEPDVLYLVRGDTSPLHIAKCQYGYIFASTYSALKKAESLVGGFESLDDKGTTVQFYTEGHYGVYSRGAELEYNRFEHDSWGGYGKYHSTRTVTTQTCPPYDACDMGSGEGDIWQEWEYGYPSASWDSQVQREKNGRPVVDVDSDGNKYVTVWNDELKIWEAIDVDDEDYANYDTEKENEHSFDVPERGWDYRVRSGSTWIGTEIDPMDDTKYIHMYSGGEFIINGSVVPPFRTCTAFAPELEAETPTKETGDSQAVLSRGRTSGAHSGALSKDEAEARSAASNIVSLFKRGKGRGHTDKELSEMDR